ncbi:hypothetical protein [Pseudooceanicola atlanticus]|uniref:hypothetical protein n=1 Tax=Pseudooceanicola atlanticus TaxID=1461694 RepID=UPI00235529C2|nr:hypothetical protein [Pseudooceanicola atlanticus]
MNEDVESFRLLLKDSPDLKDRWDSLVTLYTAEAAALGVTVSASDLMTVNAIRLHCLTGDGTIGDWKQQASESIPAFREKAEAVRAGQILADTADERHDAVAAEFDRLSPQEKMRRAREMGQTLPGPLGGERKPMTDEERAKALRDMDRLPPGMKLARYRELFG